MVVFIFQDKHKTPYWANLALHLIKLALICPILIIHVYTSNETVQYGLQNYPSAIHKMASCRYFMLARMCSFVELHGYHGPPELLPNIKGSRDLKYIKTQ